MAGEGVKPSPCHPLMLGRLHVCKVDGEERRGSVFEDGLMATDRERAKPVRRFDLFDA